MKLSKPSDCIDTTEHSTVFDANNSSLVMSFPVTDASLLSGPSVTDCSSFSKTAPSNGRRVSSNCSVPSSELDLRTETHSADYSTALPAVYRAEPLSPGFSGYSASVSGDIFNCPRRVGEPYVRGTLGNNYSVSGEVIAVTANNDRACETVQSLSKSPGMYQENKSLHSNVSRLQSGTKNVSLLPTQSLNSPVMSSHFVTIDGSADLGFQEDSKVFTIDKDSIHISQDSPDLLLSEMNLVPLDDDFSGQYPSDGGLGDLHALGDGAVAPDIFAVNGVKTAFITSQGPFTTLPHCTSFFLDNSNLSIDIDGLYDDDICANLADADALEKIDSPQKKGTANTELTFSHVFKSVNGKKPEKDVDTKVSFFEPTTKTAPFPASFEEKPFISDSKAKMLSFKNVQQTKVKIEEQLFKKDLLVQQVSCFQCKLCSFLAVEKSSMQDHMKVNHQEYLSDTEESEVDEQILKTKRVKVFMPRSSSCQASAFTETLSKPTTEEERALQNSVLVPKIKTRVFHSTSTSKKTHYLNDQGPVHKKIKIVHVSDVTGPSETNTFADIENTTLMKPITSVSAMMDDEASSDAAVYRKVKMVVDGHSRGAGTSGSSASNQQGGRSSRKTPSIKSGRPTASKSQGIARMKKMCKLEQSEEELFGYKCDIGGCGLRVRSKENLEYHRGCHTDDGGTGLVCPECQASVSRWRLLATHLWREHRVDIDLHRCQHCDFRCYSLSRLHTSHLPSHSNERPFLCETCGKVFKTSKQLRYHKTNSHSGQPVTSFICTACNKQFVEKRLLLQHMDVLHNNIRRHLCSYCGKAFGSSNTLNLHLRTHTGEKPFACPSCPYRTSDHNTLRRHLMQHSKVKPYRCSYCPYSAIQSTSYKVHLAEKHKQQAVTDNLLFSCQHCKFMSVRHDMYRSHLATKHNITMPPCAPPVVSRGISNSTSGSTNVTNTSSIVSTTVNNITSTVASCNSASISATSISGNPTAGGGITVNGVMQRTGYASDVMLETVTSTGSFTDTITGPVILAGLSSGSVGASGTACLASAYTAPLTIPATFVITANTRQEEKLTNTTKVSKVVKILPALKVTRGPGTSGSTSLTAVAAGSTDGASVSARAMETFAVTERSTLGLRNLAQAAQSAPTQRASFRPGTIFYSDVLLEEMRWEEVDNRQQQAPAQQQQTLQPMQQLQQQTLPVQQFQPQQTLLVQQQTLQPMQQLTLQPVQQQRLQEHLQQQRLADKHPEPPKIQRVTLQQHRAYKQQSEQQHQHQQIVEQRQPSLQQQRQRLPSQRQQQRLAPQKQPTQIVATQQQQQRQAPRQQQQTHIVVSQKQQKCTTQQQQYKLLPPQQQQIILHQQQQRLTPQKQKQHRNNVYIIP